jgi:hypothetical protein
MAGGRDEPEGPQQGRPGQCSQDQRTGRCLVPVSAPLPDEHDDRRLAPRRQVPMILIQEQVTLFATFSTPRRVDNRAYARSRVALQVQLPSSLR